MRWHIFHDWQIIPIFGQRNPVFVCSVCGKKSWECRWFPDRFRWFY